MQIQPGAILLNGKYRIDAEVGHGAFGVVYRATHLELNVPRAIKMLREDAPGVGSTIFTTYRGRFRNEFQLAARIDNSNLIKVYDFVEEDGALFAVMEYAPGGSLADLLGAKGTLEIEQAARLIRGAAEGLRALHEELEAIHRDVKPNNILLDRAGQAKVADFGLAQVGGFGMSVDSRLSGQAMPHPGTPNYASPEHANGGEPLTPSSDVYSLGCVAFELLTGKLWKTQQARARGPRDLRPEVPEWLDSLVRRMLLRTPGLTVDDAGDAAKRFVDMRGVLAALDPQLQSAERRRTEEEKKANDEAERIERLRAEDAKRQALERERAAKIARLREELAEAERLGQIDATEGVVAAWLALAPNDVEAIAARGRITAARQRERDARAAEEARLRELERERDRVARSQVPMSTAVQPLARSQPNPVNPKLLVAAIVIALFGFGGAFVLLALSALSAATIPVSPTATSAQASVSTPPSIGPDPSRTQPPLTAAPSATVAPPLGPRPAATSAISAGKLDVGIVLPTKDEPRWTQDQTRFQEAFKAAGANAEVLFSERDSAKEKANVEALIAKGIKVLILTAQDDKVAGAAAEVARRAGVKVIAYDRLILNTDAVDYYVTFDSVAIGEAMGQYLVENATGNGNNLYLYAGAASDPNAFLFFEGAWNKLQPKIADGTFVIRNASEAVALQGKATLVREDQAKIVGQVSTNWDFNTARSLAEAHLTKAGAAAKGTVYILAPNDGTARGIAEAFSADKSVLKYYATGQDAEKASLQYIIDGKQSMTVLKDVRTLAKDAIAVALAYVKNETPAKTTTYSNGKADIPARPSAIITVTKANFKAAIVDSGYYSASDFKNLAVAILAGKLAVGVVLPTKDEPRWIQDQTRFQEALRAAGADAEILFSDRDSAKEMANVEALISRGIKVLILTAQDGKVAGAAAEVARRAGVKVIAYDRLILNTDAVDYYVTFDAVAIGEAMGQYLVENATGNGNNLYLYTGAVADSYAFLFFEGAWNKLQPKIADGTFVVRNSSEAVRVQGKAKLTRDDQAKIIGQVTTNWDPNTAFSLAEANLARVGAAKGKVYILAPNDGMARVVADVFAADNAVTKYFVTGQDAEKASLQYIIDGKQSMTVLKDVRTLVKDAIAAALAYVKNETPAMTTTYGNGKADVPAKPSAIVTVTKANFKAAIVDSGYYPASDFRNLP